MVWSPDPLTASGPLQHPFESPVPARPPYLGERAHLELSSRRAPPVSLLPLRLGKRALVQLAGLHVGDLSLNEQLGVALDDHLHGHLDALDFFVVAERRLLIDLGAGLFVFDAIFASGQEAGALVEVKP